MHDFLCSVQSMPIYSVHGIPISYACFVVLLSGAEYVGAADQGAATFRSGTIQIFANENNLLFVQDISRIDIRFFQVLQMLYLRGKFICISVQVILLNRILHTKI